MYVNRSSNKKWIPFGCSIILSPHYMLCSQYFENGTNLIFWYNQFIFNEYSIYYGIKPKSISEYQSYFRTVAVENRRSWHVVNHRIIHLAFIQTVFRPKSMPELEYTLLLSCLWWWIRNSDRSIAVGLFLIRYFQSYSWSARTYLSCTVQLVRYIYLLHFIQNVTNIKSKKPSIFDPLIWPYQHHTLFIP